MTITEHDFAMLFFFFSCSAEKRSEKGQRVGLKVDFRKTHTNTTAEDSFTLEQLRPLQRSDTFHVKFGQGIAICYIQEIRNQ